MSILSDSHAITNIIHWKCYVGVYDARTVTALHSATTALSLVTQYTCSQLRWLFFVFPSVLYVENSKKKRVSSNDRLGISIVHILLKYSSFGTTLFKPTNSKVQEMQNGQLNPHVRSPGSTYDPRLPGPYFIFLITKKCYI